jgi:hypothetical protein
MHSRSCSAPRRRQDRIDREFRGITAGSGPGARFREPAAADRGQQPVERSAVWLTGKPVRRMPLSVTELTWRARSVVCRHGGVIARTAVLGVLIATSGGLARLSWLVVEQAASRPPPPGIMQTAASRPFPAPGRLSGPAAGYPGSQALAAWCWSPHGQATAPVGSSGEQDRGGVQAHPDGGDGSERGDQQEQPSRGPARGPRADPAAAASNAPAQLPAGDRNGNGGI